MNIMNPDVLAPYSLFDQKGEADFTLTSGIIGFPNLNYAQFVKLPDNPPFFMMKLSGAEAGINFIVIQSQDIGSFYEPLYFNGDLVSMDITQPSEALTFNVVTLNHKMSSEASVNLIGPILLNLRTRIARQFIISNYTQYSAHHLLRENQNQSVEISA